MMMPAPSRRAGDQGFSLLEIMIALSILLVGLLGMAQVFYYGLAIAGTSSAQLIAREKAREAIESVHTARDTRVITWEEIRNVSAPDCSAWPTTTAGGGGVFMDGQLDMLAAGPDGIVQTDDDDGEEMTPGPDNTLGTGDDVPLEGFTREIVICDVNGNANLRQVVVTIRYPGSSAIGLLRRSYTLTTYISSYS
jgi:prepilin-type N-terminal cleavage/methylation domain-containing protein